MTPAADSGGWSDVILMLIMVDDSLRSLYDFFGIVSGFEVIVGNSIIVWNFNGCVIRSSGVSPIRYHKRIPA